MVIETGHIVCGSGSMKWYIVHLSVCTFPPATAVCGGFAAVDPAGRQEIRLIAVWPTPSNSGATAAWRSAAVVSSATFPAAVEG